MEVTPPGRVVWEYDATWAPYDAERLGTGPGSKGPTMRERNATGTVEVHGGAGLSPAARRSTPDAWLVRATAGMPLAGGGRRVASWWAQRAPWYRPVWLSPWAFLSAVCALVVAVAWAGTESYLRWGDAVSARVVERGGGPGRRDR